MTNRNFNYIRKSNIYSNLINDWVIFNLFNNIRKISLYSDSKINFVILDNSYLITNIYSSYNRYNSYNIFNYIYEIFLYLIYLVLEKYFYNSNYSDFLYLFLKYYKNPLKYYSNNQLYEFYLNKVTSILINYQIIKF
jgi:hypothetical protein